MKKMRYLKLSGLLLLFASDFFIPSIPSTSVQGVYAQPIAVKPFLSLTDKLSDPAKEVIVETADWEAVFSLHYNGGIYKLYDKVNDPEMKDNLLGNNGGGVFNYNVKLLGNHPFSTSYGFNDEPSLARLDILERTPVRIRLRQSAHLRLIDGSGPPSARNIELNMVEAATEWTIYPTGRVNINFDAEYPVGWTGIIAQGPGGVEKGISTDGRLITAVNGADFHQPWVAAGDTIESKTGGWGPLLITLCQNNLTLRVAHEIPKGEKLDFTIRRVNITEDYLAITADGSVRKNPRESTWEGGSNGVPVYGTNFSGPNDKYRGKSDVPLGDVYILAHWTRPPRGFGTLLALNEPFTGVNFSLINDTSWENSSYTVLCRQATRPFEPQHRHFMVQMGIENGKTTPKIKGIPDALPFADDYRNPYAEARIGALMTGEGISVYGFHIPTGAYQIAAKNKVAAIAFDAARGKTVKAPLPYLSPAIMVFGLNVADAKLAVDLSKDNGKTYQPLAASGYNITIQSQADQLGGADRRLFQLLNTVPAGAVGPKAWVLRFRQK